MFHFDNSQNTKAICKHKSVLTETAYRFLGDIFDQQNVFK